MSTPEKEEKKKRLKRGDLKKSTRIFRFLRPYRLQFGIGMIFLFATSGVSLAFPVLLGRFFEGDAATVELNMQQINANALFLFIMFMANALFSYARVVLFAHATQNALANLRQEVYDNLIRLPMTFFNSRRVGELNSRISADASLLETTFTTTFAEFFRQIIIIVGGIIMLSLISPRLTLVMLAVVPVVALGAVVFGRFIRKLSKETQEVVAASNTIVEETIQGIATVKAFATELFEIGRYNKATNDAARIAIKNAKYRGAFVAYIIFCLFGSIIAVIWYGALLWNSGDLGFDQFLSFIMLTIFVGASFGGIADLYTQLVRAVGATENLMELLEETPEQTARQAPEHLQLRGAVAFEYIEFAYPNRADIEVLKGISFAAQPGEQVALVGPSGSGKSTIANLLLRFYDQISGSIRIDGKPIADYALTALRQQISIVPQDVLLFGGTIRENIAYAKPEASEAEIREAATKANALNFIEGFPEGFETIVGERGVQLSGGQRQRIAIARAVLKDPAILILDEATSSLDSESERVVQEALEKLMRGRTSIVIAHRLSTIRSADKILVLEHGQIKEQGTHEELMQQENGLYKSLSALQLDLRA